MLEIFIVRPYNLKVRSPDYLTVVFLLKTSETSDGKFRNRRKWGPLSKITIFKVFALDRPRTSEKQLVKRKTIFCINLTLDERNNAFLRQQFLWQHKRS